MRVDNPGHGPHDHRFGHGAEHPEPPEHHDIGLGVEQRLESDAGLHGLLDGVESHAHAGGHVEVGHFDHDFHADHGLHGLDGLHDSVHHSIGLGFGGDEHHTLHDGLHHDVEHPDPHHDAANHLHDLGHII